MDVAISWLVIIGTAGIGIAASMWWGTGSRTLAIWIGVAGVVLWVIAAGLQLQKYVWASNVPNPARANVFVETVETKNIDDDLMRIGPDKIPTITVVVKNFGQSAAYNSTHQIAARLAAYPPPENLFKLPDSIAGSVEIIPPGGRSVAEVGVGAPLNDSQKTSLGMGRMAVYLFGRIRYMDEYGQWRCTNYRYMVGGDVGFNGTAMSPMSEGNEADIDCNK